MITHLPPDRRANRTPEQDTDLPLPKIGKVLRLSRSSAYKAAEEHRATGGRSGLPTVKIGDRLMVRLVDLAAMVGVELFR